MRFALVLVALSACQREPRLAVRANPVPSAAPTTAHPKTPKPSWDGARIVLQRTSCFGSCPVYRVTIDADGAVFYEGEHYVQTNGPVHSSIAPGAAIALLDRAWHDGFYDWPTSFRANCSDMPDQFVGIRTREGLRVIWHYGGTTPGHTCSGAPKEVIDLEDAVDQTAGTAKWVKCAGDCPWKTATPPAIQGCSMPVYLDADENWVPRDECF